MDSSSTREPDILRLIPLFLCHRDASTRESLAAMLKSSGFSLVGSVATTAEADLISPSTSAGIILLELGSGLIAQQNIELAGRMGRLHRMRVIFLMEKPDSRTLALACDAAPAGFLLLPTSPADLRSVLAQVEENRRSARSLRISEHIIRETLGSIADIVLVVDLSGRIIFANAAAEEFFGKTESDLLESSLRNLLCGQNRDLRKRLSDLFDRVAAGQHSVQTIIDTVLRHPSLKDRNIALGGSLSPLRRPGGEPEGIILLVNDITETRRQREQLRKLSSAIRNAHDSVLITAPDGTIEYVNPAFERMTGYTWQEAVGRTPRLLKSGHHPEGFYRNLWKRLKDGESVREIFVNRRKDGATYYQEETISPVLNDCGLVEYFVAMSRDVTSLRDVEDRLRMQEEDLVRANQQLEQMVKARSQFIATVSHEIRTPLAVIKSGVDNVLDELTGPVTPEQKQVLDMVAGNVRRLTSLIGNVLEFEKLEANVMRIDLKVTDLSAVVRTAVADMRYLIEDRGFALATELPDQPILVQADPDRISQVVTNLAGNATKYARSLVTVSLSERGNRARLEVSDDGNGIPSEKIDIIFEAFLQAEHHDQKEGTGLGLSIVRQIARAHNGRVWAENRVGGDGRIEGARFITEIPLVDVRPRTS